jgi:hypothetical protein
MRCSELKTSTKCSSCFGSRAHSATLWKWTPPSLRCSTTINTTSSRRPSIPARSLMCSGDISYRGWWYPMASTRCTWEYWLSRLSSASLWHWSLPTHIFFRHTLCSVFQILEPPWQFLRPSQLCSTAECKYQNPLTKFRIQLAINALFFIGYSSACFFAVLLN